VPVNGANDVRYTKIHTAQPLELEPVSVQYVTVIKKLKSCKSSGINQIPAELFQAGGKGP